MTLLKVQSLVKIMGFLVSWKNRGQALAMDSVAGTVFAHEYRVMSIHQNLSLWN